MIVAVKFCGVRMFFLSRLNLCMLECESTVHPDLRKTRLMRCVGIPCGWGQGGHLLSLLVCRNERDTL